MSVRLVLLLTLLVSAPQEAKLTLVTYNVLADSAQASKRVPPLLKILADADADVIALQEVAPWFLARLRREAWATPYHLALVGGDIEPGGQLILSRFPVTRSRSHRLPGPQKRTVLVATLRTARGDLTVATTHMESPLADGPVRGRQLEAIFRLLKEPEHAVFLGDLNFGDGEQPETARLDNAYVDVWTSLKPSDAGFTWNIETSDMAKKGSFPGEKSRRIDRILLRSRTWTPLSIRIVGNEPVTAGDKGLFPSDHFGLVATLGTR